MSCSDDYTIQLHALGYRMTPQRKAILHVLRQSGEHLTAKQVFKNAIKEFPSLTESTVYRTLDFLVRIGVARFARTGKKFPGYQIIGHEHHHLICRNCGKEIEIDHGMVESIYQQLEAATGYKLSGSHNTFLGLCKSCQVNSEA
jgi:Fe2+ or Zn2+ uptake regulation protein